MAPVAVWTRGASKDHPAHLRLVARVPDHGAELGDPVGELAVVPVRTRAGLLPLVAQLRLDHPLVVHLQLQRLLFLVPLPRHIHLLLYPRHTLSKLFTNERKWNLQNR